MIVEYKQCLQVFNNRLKLLSILCGAFLLVFVTIHNQNFLNRIRCNLTELKDTCMHSLSTLRSKNSNRTFLILWYAKQPYFEGHFNFSGCEFTNCDLTEDKTKLNTSDVVLFAYRDMRNVVPFKKKEQIWVVVNIESPNSDAQLSSIWDNKFDWSMTYRKDSEILLNYLTFKRNTTLEKDYHAIFKNKTKFASWAVSNCNSNSRRTEYVQELKKYIEIDIYGRCGDKSCPSGTMPGCHEALSQNYKFYLGLENSLCKDYATEKVFHTFLDNSNAIYISRGAPNIKSLVPPNTIIDANDFTNPKALAEYMIKLGSNESEYTSYLKEIDKYHIDNERNYWRAMCDLCKLSNTYKTRTLSWTGRNFNKFYRENACVDPQV